LIEVTSEAVGLRRTEAERGTATDANGVELA
jgi:hypothetical protein